MASSSFTFDADAATATRLLEAMNQANESSVRQAIAQSQSHDALWAFSDMLLQIKKTESKPESQAEDQEDTLESGAKPVAAKSADDDSDWDDNETISSCCLRNIAEANKLEHGIKTLIEEGHHAKDLRMTSAEADFVTQQLRALGESHDLSQSEYLRSRCDMLAYLEWRVHHMHTRIVEWGGGGNEAKKDVKTFDEQILFKVRTALLHRVASDYLWHGGDTTDTNAFKQVLKNTYTKFFTGDEKILKEKLAQISQALSKAQAPGSVNLFPEMKSNNKKEQDRRGGRKRDSRANRREKAAAAAASEDSWHHVFYTSHSWQGGCYRAARASGPAFSIVQSIVPCFADWATDRDHLVASEESFET